MSDDPEEDREGAHEHTFVFLRQETLYDNPTHKDDVFFCSGCLEYKRVEVWRGRYGF